MAKEKKQKKEKKVADLGDESTKQMLINFISSIQTVEKNIKMLNEEKSDIVKAMKEEGFNAKLINQVIKEIRKQLEASPIEQAEKEVYFDLLAQANVIETLK